MWGEALRHEIFDNNKIIQNIFPCYFQQTNQPHFIHLSGHRLCALNASADSTLQDLQQKQIKESGQLQTDPPRIKSYENKSPKSKFKQTL